MPTASRWAVVGSAGQLSKATVLWGSPDCPARAAARAFGPGATNPRATTDGGQHFFQAGKRCHSLRAGRRRLCNTTGLNFATTGIPGLPSTCRTQHVPSAQVLLTPVLRLTAGSTSPRREEGVTPSEREEGVYVTPVVTGWPPLQTVSGSASRQEKVGVRTRSFHLQGRCVGADAISRMGIDPTRCQPRGGHCSRDATPTLLLPVLLSQLAVATVRLS